MKDYLPALTCSQSRHSRHRSQLGLGRTASLAFARHGATVALLARDAQDWKRCTTKSWPPAARAAMFPYDLAAADDRSLETLAGTIAHHLKRLDGLLHSAHQFYSLTPLELQTLEQWQTLMRST